MTSERALPVLLILSLGVVVYQQIAHGTFPPSPAPMVGVAIAYSLLAVLAIIAPGVAAALGVAIVIWLVLAYHGALTPSKGAATQ